MERRYSNQGCSVWYYTEETVHPEHDKKIISGLTNSPKSKISSKATEPADISHRLPLGL